MENTDFSAACESSIARTVSILGTPTLVKGYCCSPDGRSYPEKSDPVKLMLSILLTRFCDARCPFCIAGPAGPREAFNLDALEEILFRLKAEDRVLCVQITGGEPFSSPETLNEVLNCLFRILGTKLSVSVTTSGTDLHRLRELENLSHVDAVHISRHHWEDAENDRIFGRKRPSAVQLKETLTSVPFRDLFVMNCLLLRGGADSPMHVHQMLDFAIEEGFSKVGFITPAPVNAWTRDHLVPYTEVLKRGDPSLLFTRGFQDYAYCRCQDGVYVSAEGRLIEWYGRMPESARFPYSRGLVLTPEGRLLDGFGGRVLYDAGAKEGKA